MLLHMGSVRTRFQQERAEGCSDSDPPVRLVTGQRLVCIQDGEACGTYVVASTFLLIWVVNLGTND